METKNHEAKCSKLGSVANNETVDNDNQLKIEDHARNPLDIAEILSMVMGYIVKIEDLKNVRLVSSRWKNETLKRWRNTAVFLINKNTKNVLLEAHESNEDDFLLKEFPFKNYRFQDGMRPRYVKDLLNTLIPKVILLSADYLDIGQCEITGCRFLGNDQLRFVLLETGKVKELVVAPLRKEGPFSFNWNYLFSTEGIPKNINSLRKLTLSVPPPQPQRKKGKNVPLFQLDPQFGGDVENAYWFVLRRMPNLKALHEISGNGTYNILAAMIHAARKKEMVIRLEDITVLATQVSFLPQRVGEYFSVLRPPLQTLKIPVSWIDCVPRADFIQSLQLVQDTLTKIDLEIDCNRKGSRQLARCENVGLYLNGRYFPNIINFKIEMVFEVGSIGKLLSFDLNHIRKMPKLQDFFFGFKNPIAIPEGVALTKKIIILEEAPTWINERNQFAQENTASLPKGVQVDSILNGAVEEDGLGDLKSFHFHQNLAKESLQLLGKWTKNLKTLETVLDEENFAIVRGSWKNLQNLKLLKGSKIAKEQFGSVNINVA